MTWVGEVITFVQIKEASKDNRYVCTCVSVVPNSTQDMKYLCNYFTTTNHYLILLPPHNLLLSPFIS